MYGHPYWLYHWQYPMPWNNHQWSNPSYNQHTMHQNHWNNMNGNFPHWNPPPAENIRIRDYGSQPFVVNMEKVTKQNNTFRTALWTGKHFQLTLMSIGVGEDIGLEVHPHLDQFLRIEQGQGIVQMGDSKTNLDFQTQVFDNYSIFVPAGKWHNLTNTGNVPIKLYSIYAPPEHPFGTVHETKAIAMAAEENHH